MNTKTIPKEWKIVTVDDVCENLDSKRVPISREDRSAGEIPYYGATGIVDYVNDFIFDEELVLVGEDGADWSGFANTSFLINGKSWVNNHAHVLRCKKINSIFLVNFLNYKDLRDCVNGSTRGKLNKSDLMDIKINLPPQNEQNKIAEILSSVDDKILINKQIKNKLAELKKGLMQDLLSGRIRVVV